MNITDSDYSDKHASVPDRIVLVIQHNGDSFKYHLERTKDGKKGSYDVDLTIGGEPLVSDEAGIVKVEWKGDRLEIQTLYNPGQDRESGQNETWSLSADGKKLIDDLRIHPPRKAPEVHVKRVFDKQP